MRAYVIKRLCFMAATLLVITMVSYGIMRLAPGTPIRARMLGGEGAGVSSTTKRDLMMGEALKKKYHLDRNVVVGYGFWLQDLAVRFDWGTSIVVDPGAPVTKVIAERLPATLKLNLCAIALVYLLAVPLGILSAVWKGKAADRVITVGLFVLYSLPSYWVALLLMIFLCGDVFVHIFPVAGLEPDSFMTWGASYWAILRETGRHYVLPVFCLTYASLAGLSRYTRVGMLEIVRQDYVRTARAKGLPEHKVILKHVFRNGLIPLVTLFADLLPGLIAGSIVLEYVFSINGMGNLSVTALSSRDYPLMMALFTIGAVLELMGILLSDLLYAMVDPRVTFEHAV